MFAYITNRPDLRQALTAWKNSRPTEQDADFTRMAYLDLPVNEFTRINLFIESTIIEREIIATMRNHVMWAQTSRVQDCREFEIDYETNPILKKHGFLFAKIKAEMVERSEQGERQDDYRLSLPLFSNTRYSIATDVRTVIKLGLYFLELSKLSPGIEAQFKKFSNVLFEVIEAVFENTYIDAQEVIKSMKPYDFLNKKFIGFSSGKMGNVISVAATIPLHLRAQLFRHRNIHVTDNLYSLLQIESITSDSMWLPIKVRITGTEEEMKSIISKRICWIANYKVWGDLLSKIEDQLGENSDSLPCANSSCPWPGDAMLRYEGNDPNPPCPIHMKLNGLKPNTNQVEEMTKMIATDNRPMNFWSSKIQEL